jgi:hypothetical protein
MVSQEQAEEFMQVAAIVCIDIDLLKDIAEQPNRSAEELVQAILHLHEKKELLIRNADVRQFRYAALRRVFSLLQAASATLTFGETTHEKEV